MHKLAATASIILLTGVSARAQVPPAELGARYVPAPWWMRDPVISSIGHVRTELAANRASFTASFSEVADTAAEATGQAAARVQALDAQLRALGAERVRLETTFSTQALYDQYRDDEGNLRENRRADQVEGYEVEAQLQIDVRDVGVLEEAYAAVLAARPTSIGSVGFELEPSNAARTELFAEAVADAARRARIAAERAGSQLGAVKVIDPTARACQTDVLAGWPSYVGGGVGPLDVQLSERARTGAFAPPPPPPPAPAIAVTGGRTATGVQVTLQPPLRSLEAQACVVYELK